MYVFCLRSQSCLLFLCVMSSFAMSHILCHCASCLLLSVYVISILCYHVMYVFCLRSQSCLLFLCVMSSFAMSHILCHCVSCPLLSLCNVQPLSLCVTYSVTVSRPRSLCDTCTYSVNVSCLLSLSHPLSLCLMSCHPETCWEQPKQAAARPLPSSSQQSNCSTSYPSCRAMVGGA